MYPYLYRQATHWHPALYENEAWRTAAMGQKAELTERLAFAINAEHNAIRVYERLMQMAPNDDFRRIIGNIRDDEIGHFRAFSQQYAQLTGGRKPELTAAPLPATFEEGVEESIRDELEDSKFYQDTTPFADDLNIERTLLNASADEARHATWFSYIWNKMKR